MEIKEAIKKVQSTKNKDNYLLIKRDYDKFWVLPYKEGIALIGALATAEMYLTPYNKAPTITPVSKDETEIRIMSCEEYELIKVAMLLGLSPSELKLKMQDEQPIPF